MDAGLAWTIVGSAAAVVAIPAGVVIGVLQLRQGRKATEALSSVDPLVAVDDHDQAGVSQKERQPSGFVVALLTSEGRPAGVGFLAGVSEILTCAHVVNLALGRSARSQDRPREVVAVEFPLLSISGDGPIRVSARVERWIAPPHEGAGEGNIAGLRLVDNPMPEGVVPAVLATTAPRPGAVVEVFGYPAVPPRPDGGWAEARVRGSVARRRLQLEASADAALRIQPGYSGSPLCDPDTGCVVGMLALASHADDRDAYAIGVEELISIWADEVDLTISESSVEEASQTVAAYDGADDVCTGAPAVPQGSGSMAETNGEAYPRPHGHPTQLSDRQAVFTAYAHEIDLVASYLDGGSSVMLGSEKLLIQHLAAVIPTRSGRAVRFVSPSSDGSGRTDLVGSRGRRADLVTALERAMAEARTDEVIVIPNFDLLVGDSDAMLNGTANEVTDLLYECSENIILAFTDMSAVVPEVLANRFPIRIAIDILPKTVRARDGSVVPIGRALVTESEAAMFAGFDAVRLYKYIAGMNAVRLRRALHFTYQQYATDGIMQPTFASLVRELCVFKARNSTAFEVPRASLKMIGGYRDVKDMLRRELGLIMGAGNSEGELPEHLSHDLIPRGFIFSGPRGTGKTLFANAVASELNGIIRVVSSSEILGQKVAVTERQLQKLFAEARRNAPAVLVFDDIDLIAPESHSELQGGGPPANAAVALLLAELDGLRPEVPVLVICTTNRLDVLDGRLLAPGPFRLIKINLPDKSDRREIALYHANHFSIAVDDESLDMVARLTEGMTGADICSVFRDARADERVDGHRPIDAVRLIELIGLLRNSRQ